MGKLEDDQNALYPPGAPAPPGQTTAAPTPDANSQNAVDPLTAQQNRLYPPPAPTDADITGNNFWNLPSGVSQGDYWTAEGRKMAGALKDAATDVGTVYADDATFGAGTAAAALQQGKSPAEYRAAVDAARENVGASRWGIDAMAFLTSPYKYLRAGKAAEAGILAAGRTIAPRATNAAVNVAKRVGDFVEGGLYTGLESAGHGDDPATIAANTAGGGILSTGISEIARQAAPAARWARSKIYGSPEGTPAQISAAQTPGTPAEMDANQLALWRSQAAYDMPPSQSDVGGYVRSVYGPDPAQWPEALRDIHSAAGKEGAPSTAARIIGHAATQAGTATAQYLGLGLSPEVAAVLQPATAMATEGVLPTLTGYGSAPVKGAISNAYPALTGWRPELNTPGWRY